MCAVSVFVSMESKRTYVRVLVCDCSYLGSTLSIEYLLEDSCVCMSQMMQLQSLVGEKALSVN